jgi:hypothetical protein
MAAPPKSNDFAFIVNGHSCDMILSAGEFDCGDDEVFKFTV